MLSLSEIDLLQIKRSHAVELSRWLATDEALSQLETAIAKRLENFKLWRSDMVSPVYLFGREMRQVYENRSNKELYFRVDAPKLTDRAYLVFLCGFMRKDISLAMELNHLPPNRFNSIVQSLIQPQ